MKAFRYISIFFILALVVSVFPGSAHAFFSANQTSENNAWSAGTLEATLSVTASSSKDRTEIFGGAPDTHAFVYSVGIATTSASTLCSDLKVEVKKDGTQIYSGPATLFTYSTTTPIDENDHEQFQYDFSAVSSTVYTSDCGVSVTYQAHQTDYDFGEAFYDKKEDNFTLSAPDFGTQPALCPVEPLTIVSDSSTQVDGHDATSTFEHPAWDADDSSDFDGATWIWSSHFDEKPGTTTTKTFTRTFTYAGSTNVNALLHIATDNGYVVKLNGTVVGSSTAEKNFTIETYDTIDVSGATHEGVNKLEIDVTNFGVPNSTPKTNPAGLLYRLVIDDENCEEDALVSGVVLNEILPNPTGEDSNSKPNGEWVELYNNSASSVDLTGWSVSDDDGHKVTIGTTNMSSYLKPATTTIAGHGFLVVYLNEQMLTNTGDTVSLYNATPELVDSFAYANISECDTDDPTPDTTNTETGTSMCSGSMPENESFARIPDGSSNWVDPVPTPGTPNETSEVITPDFEITLTPALDVTSVITATDTIAALTFSVEPAGQVAMGADEDTDASTGDDTTTSATTTASEDSETATSSKSQDEKKEYTSDNTNATNSVETPPTEPAELVKKDDGSKSEKRDPKEEIDDSMTDTTAESADSTKLAPATDPEVTTGGSTETKTEPKP